MAFFKNKQKQASSPSPPSPLPCTHKWKDFPWYMDADYYTDYHEYEIKIKEPYVCVWCKERIDKTLAIYTGRGSFKDLAKSQEEIATKYKDFIEDRALIEDKINDMQLVDRDYLRALAIIRPDLIEDEQAKDAVKRT